MSKKDRHIIVKGLDITVSQNREEDYISLTDMVKNMEDGDQLIKRWLSTKNTIEFLGVWERLKNPHFNLVVFDQVKNEAGSHKFVMSVKKWKELTNGIGLQAKSGRYESGTYAHKDIAIKFAAWISPEFEMLLILEFQRLKEVESERLGEKWDMRRYISKANYKIHTDAVKEVLIPLSGLSKDKEGIIYAEEAELLNIAVFGMTSKEWKNLNVQLSLHGHNLRDMADTHQLIVLSNLESFNAELIKGQLTASQRLQYLRSAAITQLESLRKSVTPDTKLIESPHKQANEFDENLKGLLNTPSTKKDEI